MRKSGTNPIDRRNFFRQGATSVARAVSQQVEARCKQHATRWIRPPYALDEVDFLLACTRCDACINACPHGVVFKLSAACGIAAANTPALNLTHKGCHLCNDWPCVQACDSGALSMPPPQDTAAAPPLLAQATIDPTRCLPYQGPECGVCKGACPVSDALQWDGPRPVINSEACTGCALCREACFLEEKAIHITSIHQKMD